MTSRFRALAERTFLCVPPDLLSIYLDNFAVFSRDRQQELLSGRMRQDLADATPYRHEADLLERAADLGPLNRLLDLDLRTYLHELLMKQDQMSMAASLESRVPFLDHELVEWVVRLPDEWKLKGRTTKRVLREAMKGLLPESIITRPKMGFPVPFGTWVRGAYTGHVRDIVLGDRATARDLFDRTYVERLFAEHEAGADHSERLWSLLNFELWQRTFLDGEAAPTAEAPELAAVAP